MKFSCLDFKITIAIRPLKSNKMTAATFSTFFEKILGFKEINYCAIKVGLDIHLCSIITA
jgi:hypothetical protein